MIFNKTEWVLSSLALQIKRSTFGRFIHKIKKYLPPWLLVQKTQKILLQWKKKQNKEKTNKWNETKKIWIIFLFTKNDKDEFNTILKHLIKLVKNFKTHCYFFFFSNISHLATFFYSPVQVVSGLEGRGEEVGGVTGGRRSLPTRRRRKRRRTRRRRS